ncbi:hypothetical protein ATJ97_0232 [Georgenia soli]|uniref:Uncharacterized protein n=1 Tax=Georgenia soli TaxID=638953 RepID=A0A2A9F2B3_9MICO|nr:hypothetical protein [Georgenia soli]PFG44956.1 hypothetical protein ATJ97_0232 [Georgenia soli]
MARPQVRLSGLITYLNAPPLGRARAAESARGGDYRFYADYYAALRQAVRRDRTTSRDGAAVVAAAMNATAKKRPRYTDLAAKWGSVSARWGMFAAAALPPRAVVRIGGLDVSISPTFAEESPLGETEIVMVRYAEAPLEDIVIDAVLRLMERAYPGTVAVFVDLSCSHVVTSRERKHLHRYDSWLESEAAGLAHLLATAA